MSRKMRRIAILTGGGDVPGLNNGHQAGRPRAKKEGIAVVGIRRGWGGLINYRPDGDEDNRHWRHRTGLEPRADDRPHRRHLPAHLADEPGPGEAKRTCRSTCAGPTGPIPRT
jgi:hypothetical protein